MQVAFIDLFKVKGNFQVFVFVCVFLVFDFFSAFLKFYEFFFFESMDEIRMSEQINDGLLVFLGLLHSNFY